MKGFTLYQAHTAMNLHFSSGTYDYFRYNGKTRQNYDTFKKERFKWQYAALEDKLDHILWFLYQLYEQYEFSYLPAKTLLYVGNKKVKRDDYIQHPSDYLNRVVVSDLKWLYSKYQGSVECFHIGTLYPNLYEDFKQNSLSFTTVLLLDSLITKVFTKDQSQDIITWPRVVSNVQLIQPFVEEMFDTTEVLSLFKHHYLQQ